MKKTAIIPVTAMASIFLLYCLSGPAFSQDSGKDKKKKAEAQKEDRKVQGSTSVSVLVPTVAVGVVVTDKNENLVANLPQSAFSVLEDGTRQEITNFFADSKPVNVVLLMETSRLIQGIERDFWQAAMDFIRNLRPDDYCALVTYDTRPRIAVDFTLDKGEIMNEANASLYFKGFSESALSDAVVYVLDRMKEVTGKKAIILLATGLDTFSKINYDKALKIAGQSDTVLYSIAMGQYSRLVNEQYYSQETESNLRMADLRLRSFAQKTGGMSFFPRFPGEYPAVFRNINMYLRYQYTLAYRPLNQDPKIKNRKIKVEVTADIDGDDVPDKLKVFCKDGYQFIPGANND